MEKSTFLYAEPLKLISLKKFYTNIWLRSVGVFIISIVMGVVLGVSGFIEFFLFEQMLLLLLLFLVIVLTALLPYLWVNEVRCFHNIRVTANHRLQLISAMEESYNAEEIEKIVFDANSGEIVIYTKAKKKIKIKRNDMFDMQRDKPENEYRLRGLLKALKAIGVKYEIIYRE